MFDLLHETSMAFLNHGVTEALVITVVTSVIRATVVQMSIMLHPYLTSQAQAVNNHGTGYAFCLSTKVIPGSRIGWYMKERKP